jgi:hypothetical protein
LNLSVLKAVFEMPPPPPPLPLGYELRELLVRASADFLMQSAASKMRPSKHLALPPSHCKPVNLSVPIHNNPVGLTLNYWRWCVLYTYLIYFCLTSNKLNLPAASSIYPQLDSLRR